MSLILKKFFKSKEQYFHNSMSYSCVPNTQAGCNKRAGVLNLLNRAFLPARFYVVKMAEQAGKSSKTFCCEHARVLGTPEYTKYIQP